MSRFQKFVRENEKWFRGRHPETDLSLNHVETELQLSIPVDLRWVLKEYGYWHATGVSDIEESILDTKAAREHLKLPHQYLVLYDHQDGGVVLLDTNSGSETNENRVIDSSWESVPDDIENEIIYPGLVEYAERLIEQYSNFLDPGDIVCPD